MGSIIINGITGEVCYVGEMSVMSEAIADKFDEKDCSYKRTREVDGFKIYSITYNGGDGSQPLVGITWEG